MKLEVGMYVRTDKGYIGKITYCRETAEMVSTDIDKEYLDVDYGYGISFREITKASHNIIDLIEEKDLVVLEYYVAKYRERIQRTFAVNKFGNYILFENLHCSFTLHLEDGKYIWTDAEGCKPKIKEILTKEQFEAMAYKVV